VAVNAVEPLHTDDIALARWRTKDFNLLGGSLFPVSTFHFLSALLPPLRGLPSPISSSLPVNSRSTHINPAVGSQERSEISPTAHRRGPKPKKRSSSHLVRHSAMCPIKVYCRLAVFLSSLSCKIVTDIYLLYMF